MKRFVLTILCLLALSPVVRAQVTFPSAETEFIAGPLVRQAHIPWYDQTAFEKGIQHGEAFPAAPPLRPMQGTVEIAKDGRTVRGTGTRFLSVFVGDIRTVGYHLVVKDAAGVDRDLIVTAVASDTELEVSTPWWRASTPAQPARYATADELDAYVNLNYYDQGLVQYVNYYRTGDARYLAYARKIVDSWWKLPAFAEGRADVEESLSPRNSSLAGLMLRALDGRPEMFPWLTEYVQTQFRLWVLLRRDYPGFYFGIRDGGYMLLHAANLARVHPDPAVRADLRAKVLDGAVNYYVRLQGADGGFYFELDGMVGLTTQPFQEGILAEGLIAAHRLTSDERVKTSIVRLAEHLYNRAYSKQGWRGFYYFVGGRFLDGTDCSAGCGAAANPFPPSDTGQVAEARQLNGPIIHTFGYAYALTGDAKFKTWGDEILDATFSGADGYRGLCAFRAKEYDECFRSSGTYLARRLGGRVPQPTPTPMPPTPTPTPVVPTPTPTPPPPSPTPMPPLPPAVENVSAITIGGGGGWKRAGQDYLLPIKCYDLFNKQVSCPPGMEIINTNAQVGTFDVFGNFRALVPGRTFLAVRYGTFLGQSLQIRVQ